MSHGLLKMLLSTRGTLLQHTHAVRCRRAEHTRGTLHKGSTHTAVDASDAAADGANSNFDEIQIAG